MAWDASKPAGADKIKDSDNNIRLNNDAIETVLGTNITAGPTTIQGAILGDATKGRNLRAISFYIQDGTNATTLNCITTNKWNGDIIAATDNIAKNATTGDFTLSADGTTLTIEASGLTGNALMSFATMVSNASGTALDVDSYQTGNDIVVILRHTTTAVAQDMTTLVDTNNMIVSIIYVTDA